LYIQISDRVKVRGEDVHVQTAVSAPVIRLSLWRRTGDCD
jgi:hypothetical protein